tara:strand:- start:786 stop:1373 length:588 start_codon:yes stop_codon:yes gene_type:complete
MRILIACEYSATVREAFAKKGHDVMSCDIEPTDVPGPHYQGDIFDVLYQDWDMMIAHPPCTYLSNAGARFLYPGGKENGINMERYTKGLEAKEFFMKLYDANIPKICVENPISSKVYNLPTHTQTIQPFEYGHPFKKATRLWLKGLPPLEPTNIVDTAQSTKVPGNWFNKGGVERQKNRSKFFEGFADAMAEQWG